MVRPIRSLAILSAYVASVRLLPVSEDLRHDTVEFSGSSFHASGFSRSDLPRIYGRWSRLSRCFLQVQPAASFGPTAVVTSRLATRARLTIPGVRMVFAASEGDLDTIDFSKFISLQVAEPGRYNSKPAVFLEITEGGKVLPVPVSPEALEGVEEALGYKTDGEIVQQAKAVANTAGGLFDNLPWSWNPRRSGQGRALVRLRYLQYDTPMYELVLNMIRKDACAHPTMVLLEKAGMDGGNAVIGGCLVLERKMARTDDFAEAQEFLAEIAETKLALCECLADEAIGIAGVLNSSVLVEKDLWDNLAVEPKYSEVDNRIDLSSPPEVAKDTFSMSATYAPIEWRVQMQKDPWEIESMRELQSMSIEDKAASVLKLGLRLPRPRKLTDEALLAMLLPRLNKHVQEDVRHRYDIGDQEFAYLAFAHYVELAPDVLEKFKASDHPKKQKLAEALVKELNAYLENQNEKFDHLTYDLERLVAVQDLERQKAQTEDPLLAQLLDDKKEKIMDNLLQAMAEADAEAEAEAKAFEEAEAKAQAMQEALLLGEVAARERAEWTLEVAGSSADVRLELLKWLGHLGRKARSLVRRPRSSRSDARDDKHHAHFGTKERIYDG